jgi:hypothetical protein
MRVVPITVEQNPPKPVPRTAIGLANGYVNDVNRALTQHRDQVGAEAEYLTPEGIQARYAAFGDTSAPEYLNAARELVGKSIQDEVTQREIMRAELAANGSALAQPLVTRLERTVRGCEQAKAIEACKQAMINAPSDAAKCALADELPSILASKGIEETGWIEPELSRAVTKLAEADARIQQREKAKAIVAYNAATVEKGLRKGQPAGFLVDASPYDPDRD